MEACRARVGSRLWSLSKKTVFGVSSRNCAGSRAEEVLAIHYKQEWMTNPVSWRMNTKRMADIISAGRR